MRGRAWIRGICRGLAAVMIAGVPLLYIGPPRAVSAISPEPPPKAAFAVSAIPAAAPLWRYDWLGPRVLDLAAFRRMGETQAESGLLKAPTPIVPAEEACREDGVKRAYLTFDDGPTPGITEDLLATLDTYGVKATFFVIGRMAAQHPELLHRIRAGGHTIGNHSYSHRYGVLYSSVTAFTRDLERAEAFLMEELGPGYDLRLYRFTGGINWPVPMGRFIDACTERGYCHVEWNALNGDAEQGGSKSVEALMERLRESCAGKEDVIVLMHDSTGKETTAEALPLAIEYLDGEGYQFCLLR
jgi:peptidoglycan/xylan/chitin deacetylase (PgdA/CDA1 family)